MFEESYKNLINIVVENGQRRGTRNAETLSMFGTYLAIPDLLYGKFPLLTSRKSHYLGPLGELAAFFKGPKHLSDFEKEGCNYWGQWSDEDGTIRVDYGNKWLNFNGVNQLDKVLDSLKVDPFGRRHVVTGWDPSTLDTCSLPCCHMMYQFYVTNDGYLDMMWYQRSVDVMVGLPADAALAAAWLIVFSDLLGYKPGTINMSFGDTHIYVPHITSGNVDEYLSTPMFKAPNYETDFGSVGLTHYSEFSANQISFPDYQHQPSLKFEVFA